MSDQKPVYEYALVRLVPRVEREEFINAGVILYCKDKKYLNMEFLFDAERLKALDHLADGPILEENLKAFQKIARGQSEESEISGLDLPSRFRWLTARRSTMVQTSVVHPGICQNEPEDIMDHLMEMFVKP
jgi:hypothetical protein